MDVSSSEFRPIVVDLYSGAGGLSLGMEKAGFDVVAAVEFDPVHVQTHRFNFPKTPVLCGDLGKVSGAEILASAESGWATLHGDEPFPGIDAIVGGPPCQGFSAGGLRTAGDLRNEQLNRFVEIVIDLKPAVFCLENVAGLLESRFAGLRDHAFEALEAAGYSLSGTDSYFNAKDFGVPQSRKRVIVLGGLGGAPKLVAPSISTQVTVGDALEGLPDISTYEQLLNSDEATLSVADRARRRKVQGTYAKVLSGIADDPDDLSHSRIWNPAVLTSSLRTVHTESTLQRFRGTTQGKVEPKSRLFRLENSGIARTLRAGTGPERGSHTSPRPIHPTQPRVITVREAARLHGYPDWFRFQVTNWHGHRQVGNSVPPPLAAAAGRGLAESLGRVIQKPSARLDLGDAEWLRHGRTPALAAIAASLIAKAGP